MGNTYKRIDHVCFRGVGYADRGKVFIDKSAVSGVGQVCFSRMRMGLRGQAAFRNKMCSGHPYSKRNFLGKGACKFFFRATSSVRVRKYAIG